MTVATYAWHGTLEKSTNLARILDAIDAASAASVDFLVLPEICLQGYQTALDPSSRRETLQAIYRGAEPVPSGESIVAIAARAQARGLHVVYGVTERGDHPGVIYNTAVLTGPSGHIGSYRKVHLAVPEQMIWSCGDSWPVFETPLGNIGLLICYDKAWPESARELTLGGADILAMPTAWPSSLMVSATSKDGPEPSMVEQYELYDRVRALENHRWFISSNYAGICGDAEYFGLSQIVGPSGQVIATSAVTKEHMMVAATIEVEQAITDAYAGFLGTRLTRDRHPETYLRLAPGGSGSTSHLHI